MVLNYKTKFHRIIIKTIHVRERDLEHYELEEDIMVLNNVDKFHKILIKNIQVRERTSLKTANFHKQRAITTKSQVRYGLLSNLKKTLWYLTM